MKHIVKIIVWTLACAFIALLIYGFFAYLPKILPALLRDFYHISQINETEVMQNYGWLGDSYGVFNALFSALAFFAVIMTLIHQIRSNKRLNIENRFYKMLDFQQNLVSEISVFPVAYERQKDANGKWIPKDKKDLIPINGRNAFVQFKIQLKYLIQMVSDINEEKGMSLSKSDIADIAYAVFYYGANKFWKSFMMEYLKDYPRSEILVDAIIVKIQNNKSHVLGRPNQNHMSVYCRNMYNAIKMIDSSCLLTEKEKINYIKMLRAQLCNAELYVLFFNFVSRFGKKWVANNYVEKYQLIQNLPAKYCDGYEPKDYFPTIKFEGEEKCRSSFHEIIEKRG